MMLNDEIKDFLNFKVEEFNKPAFIDLDPISIPHQFTAKEDIEISAFLTATISWGNRKAILKAANEMMLLMGQSPYDFVINANKKQLIKTAEFYYRTFNGADFTYFIHSLRNIYQHHGGLEIVFNKLSNRYTIQETIGHFKELFFELPHERRTVKHVSNPMSGSAAKRINM